VRASLDAADVFGARRVTRVWVRTYPILTALSLLLTLPADDGRGEIMDNQNPNDPNTQKQGGQPGQGGQQGNNPNQQKGDNPNWNPEKGKETPGQGGQQGGSQGGQNR
jgi:hypothetical protein